MKWKNKQGTDYWENKMPDAQIASYYYPLFVKARVPIHTIFFGKVPSEIANFGMISDSTHGQKN